MVKSDIILVLLTALRAGALHRHGLATDPDIDPVDVRQVYETLHDFFHTTHNNKSFNTARGEDNVEVCEVVERGRGTCNHYGGTHFLGFISNQDCRTQCLHSDICKGVDYEWGAGNKFCIMCVAMDEYVYTPDGNVYFSAEKVCPTTTTTTIAVSATGDPHLQNTRGEHFELAASGSWELLRIPASFNSTRKLKVAANTSNLTPGTVCPHTYITSVIVSGTAVGASPMTMQVDAHGTLLSSPPTSPPSALKNMRITNSSASLKWEGARLVVRSVVGQWGSWLTLHASGLSALGTDIGGLLGSDDHELASQKSAACDRHGPVVINMQHTAVDFDIVAEASA